MIDSRGVLTQMILSQRNQNQSKKEWKTMQHNYVKKGNKTNVIVHSKKGNDNKWRRVEPNYVSIASEDDNL